MEVKAGVVVQGNPDPFWADHYLAIVKPLKTEYILEPGAQGLVDKILQSAQTISEYVQWGLKPDMQMFVYQGRNIPPNGVFGMNNKKLDHKFFVDVKQALSLLESNANSEYLNDGHLDALIHAYQMILGANMVTEREDMVTEREVKSN